MNQFTHYYLKQNKISLICSVRYNGLKWGIEKFSLITIFSNNVAIYKEEE
jgi:hypothetical protein